MAARQGGLKGDGGGGKAGNCCGWGGTVGGFVLLPLREKVAAEGRRMRGFSLEDEGGHPQRDPSSDLAPLGHLLP